LRVGISGSYGGMNLGDEAILESMVKQLRNSLKVEVVVFSKNPEDTLQRHPVERAVPVRDLTRDEARKEIEGLDVFVLGGGGILYDGEAELYLREMSLALEVKVPVMVYAVSAGPLKDQTARGMVRDALNQSSLVTVRDREALHLLEEVGVRREIRLTADPALLLEAEPLPPQTLEREGLDPERPLIGFSVREPGPAAPDIDPNHYRALLANAADFLVDRLGANIVFVSMERKHMDVQYSHAIVSQMELADRAHVLTGEYTPAQLISFISYFKFAVGMRLHFLIFAAHQGVPFVALPYASKVKGLLEDLEMRMPPLDRINTGRLIATIDSSWDMRDEIRDHIRRLFPGLQQRARETNEMLVRLLKERA
jgi:polysaccharide pyruvyl transferase CsaB